MFRYFIGETFAVLSERTIRLASGHYSYQEVLE
jgi:hypothetical protein